MDQSTSLDPATPFLQPTIYCDFDAPMVARAAANICRGGLSQTEMARRVFYWVRDSIKWELGLTPDKATETLARGAGSCTNKANLAVALMRRLGIPSGFHVMEVRAKKYLGVLCTETFGQFMKESSLHTYYAVYLNEKWLKVDPTDDIRLSNGVSHIVHQATKVDFDGKNDARLQLDPAHVIQDSPELLASVDGVLGKQRRLDNVAGRVMNLYLDFMRTHCIWHLEVKTLEADFFAWLREARPDVFADFTELCDRVASAKEESQWKIGTRHVPDQRP
jgi:hypothetical protein